MKNTLKSLAFAALASTIIFASSGASAGLLGHDKVTAEQLAKVKISIVDAIAKAQATQKGTVVKAKLENEDDKLEYEIKIIDGENKKEVKVDAISGEVSQREDD